MEHRRSSSVLRVFVNCLTPSHYDIIYTYRILIKSSTKRAAAAAAYRDRYYNVRRIIVYRDIVRPLMTIIIIVGIRGIRCNIIIVRKV